MTKVAMLLQLIRWRTIFSKVKKQKNSTYPRYSLVFIDNITWKISLQDNKIEKLIRRVLEGKKIGNFYPFRLSCTWNTMLVIQIHLLTHSYYIYSKGIKSFSASLGEHSKYIMQLDEDRDEFLIVKCFKINVFHLHPLTEGKLPSAGGVY